MSKLFTSNNGNATHADRFNMALLGIIGETGHLQIIDEEKERELIRIANRDADGFARTSKGKVQS